MREEVKELSLTPVFLIVDDNFFNVEVLEGLFQDLGEFELLKFFNPVDCLEMVKKDKP